MNKNRIEAFSDGFLAIIMTIMVLELKVPEGITFIDLLPLQSIAMCYVLSFGYLAIYWNNHHHLFQTVKKIDGKIMWANIFLLFWLSLIPFVTAWAGEHNFASLPTAFYGVVLLMAAISYYILTNMIICSQGDHSVLKEAVGRDVKGRASIVLYALAIPMSFYFPLISFLIYVFVAVLWFLPDRRIEDKLSHEI